MQKTTIIFNIFLVKSTHSIFVYDDIFNIILLFSLLLFASKDEIDSASSFDSIQLLDTVQRGQGTSQL